MLLLVAGAGGWLAFGVDRGPDPTLTVSWEDGVVLARGHDFDPSVPVDVSAVHDGGSGSALMTPDGDGEFAVRFRLPEGVGGDIRVTAVTGEGRFEETVASGPAATPGDGPLVVQMTGMPAELLPPVDSGRPRVDVPADVADDCSTDVSAALNTWLEGVPDGSEVWFGERACYRVDDSLTLENRTDLVIEGNGSTFRAMTLVPTPETNRAQWRTDYGSGIVLRNMVLVGMNDAPEFDEDNEFDHNLFIRGTRDVTVENVHGRGAYGDYIAIAHGVDETTIPGDIVIRDSSAETVGRMGISCVACDGVTVEDSVFNDIGYHVFDLEVEKDGFPTRGIRYTGNVVGRHGHAFFSVGTPFQTYDNDVSDVLISDNLVTQPGANEGDCVAPISFAYTKVPVRDVVIERNRLVSRTDAIVVRLTTGLEIRDNVGTLVEPTCGDPVGIRTDTSEDVQVTGNRLVGYE